MPRQPAPPALQIEALSPWQLYGRLGGRIGRALYWHALLGLLLLAAAINALLMIAGWPRERATQLVDVMLLWPTLALSAKRWHDSNRSAWWVLLALIPEIGKLWLVLDNGLRPGTPGTNRFGPPPPQERTVHTTGPR